MRHLLTCGFHWQPLSTPAHNAAYFILGDQAYSIKGGALFIYDGTKTEHGLWSAQGHGSPNTLGVTIVRETIPDSEED